MYNLGSATGQTNDLFARERFSSCRSVLGVLTFLWRANQTAAHPCLNVHEIPSPFARELAESEAKATAVALACCCKSFEEPVLDALWETQERLTPLLRCIPQEVWEEEGGRFVSQEVALTPLELNRLV